MQSIFSIREKYNLAVNKYISIFQLPTYNKHVKAHTSDIHYTCWQNRDFFHIAVQDIA